jgi:hypothetical protein
MEELFSPVVIHPNTRRPSEKLLAAKHSAEKPGTPPKTTFSWDYFTGRYGQALGLQCTVVQTQSVREKDISLHIKTDIPCFGIALQLQCHFTFPLCGSVSFYGNLGLPRIIPDDSEYLEACRGGDLLFVRDLFMRGIARPEDISKGNMTPLLVSYSRTE